MIEHEIVIHKPKVHVPHVYTGGRYAGDAAPAVKNQKEFDEWWNKHGLLVGSLIVHKDTHIIQEHCLYLLTEVNLDFSKVKDFHFRSGGPKNIKMLNFYAISFNRAAYDTMYESADCYRVATSDEIIKVGYDRVSDRIQEHFGFSFFWSKDKTHNSARSELS